MSTVVPTMRHVRGFDVVRPLSIGMLVFMMLPLVFLPLASIFIFGTSNGLDKFWGALTTSEAIFALKLSMATSFGRQFLMSYLVSSPLMYFRVTTFGDATHSSLQSRYQLQFQLQ